MCLTGFNGRMLWRLIRLMAFDRGGRFALETSLADLFSPCVRDDQIASVIDEEGWILGVGLDRKPIVVQ